MATSNPIKNVTTSGTTNPTPHSVVIKKLPEKVCKRVIFKRIYEDKTDLAAKMVEEQLGPQKTAPLTPLEIANPPSKTNLMQRNVWEERLSRTPLEPTEINHPPSKTNPIQRNVWEKRLSRTPLTPDEINNPPPPDGSPARQAWRKRYDLNRKIGDNYGHWWVEIYEKGIYKGEKYSRITLKASYGWWPADQVTLWETVRGVPGALNKGKKFDPHARKDWVDKNMDEAFHPVITGNDEEKLIQCIGDFARSAKGNWSYPAHPGADNCQTFQEKMIEYCKKNAGMTDGKVIVDTSKTKWD